MDELSALSITVPLTPPSVNHYKKPRGNGRGYYVSPEAEAFKAAVALVAARSRSSARREASARIAMIPFPLARWIGECYYPVLAREANA